MDQRRFEPIGTDGSKLDGRLDATTTLQKGKTYEVRLRQSSNAMLDHLVVLSKELPEARCCKELCAYRKY